MRNFWLIIKNGFAHGLHVIVSLGFAIAGTHLLSLDDYGELRTAIIILPLLMAVSLPGYDSVLLRNSNLNKPVHLLRIFFCRFTFALTGSAVLLGGLYFYQDQLSVSLLFFLLSIAILLPFFETGTGYRNYLIGTRLRDKALSLVTQSRLISIALLFIFFSGIFWLDITRLAILPAYMLALIIPVFFFFFSVALRQRFSRAGTKSKNLSWFQSEKLNLHAALATTLAGVIYTLAFSFDKLWVRYELGAAALASYAVLVMVPQEISRLFDAMIPLFYRSLFFGKDNKEKKNISLYAFFIPLISVCYVISFYFLSPFIFGQNYSYPFLTVILSGFLMCGFSFEFYCSHKVFISLGAKKLCVYSLVNLIVTIVAVIGTTKHYGEINALMIVLTTKQFIVPTGFFLFMKKRSLL